MDWPWRNTATMTKIDSAPVFKPQQPQTAHSHFVASTSTPAYPHPPPSYLITAPKHTMNRLVSFFSTPPDKRINNNSHHSSSSEMIASTNRPRTSRNDNNNQTRIGRSGDRTAITPHSSRSNYHATNNYYSQSDASDSEEEDADISTQRLRNDDVPFSVISITIMRMMTRSTLTVKNLSSRSHEEIRHPITVI